MESHTRDETRDAAEYWKKNARQGKGDFILSQEKHQTGRRPFGMYRVCSICRIKQRGLKVFSRLTHTDSPMSDTCSPNVYNPPIPRHNFLRPTLKRESSPSPPTSSASLARSHAMLATRAFLVPFPYFITPATPNPPLIES